MAATVLAASRDLPVWVICGTTAVASFAREHGAQVIWRAPEGLNRAVTQGVTVLAHKGFERVIVSHSDLPLATDLTWLADHAAAADVILVPDRHNDGSNVVLVPTSTEFRFAYGPGSAQAHELEAKRIGLSFASISDDELGWDVDVPDDLAVLSDRYPHLVTDLDAQEPS